MNYMLQGQPAYSMIPQEQPDVLMGLVLITCLYGLAYALMVFMQKQKKKEGNI